VQANGVDLRDEIRSSKKSLACRESGQWKGLPCRPESKTSPDKLDSFPLEMVLLVVNWRVGSSWFLNQSACASHETVLPSRLGACSLTFLLLIEACAGVYGQERKPGPTVSVPVDDTVGQLVSLVRGKAKVLEGSSGMAWIPIVPDGASACSREHSLFGLIRTMSLCDCYLRRRGMRASGTCIGRSRINRRIRIGSGSNGRA